MTDYIKREDAISKIAHANAYDLCAEYGQNFSWDKVDRESEIENATKFLSDIPSADVAPVRHGRWFQDAIYYGEDGSPCIVDICTECGAYGYYADFNYCPNCGAKMDEEKDDEVTAWDYPDGYFEMEKEEKDDEL